MLDSAFFTAIVDAMNPFKIIGTIRNALSPTLNFIDWQLGYEDFELLYSGRPEDKDIQPKKVYLYKENNKIYCITKEILDHYKIIKNPSLEAQMILDYGLHLSEDYIGKNLSDALHFVFNNPDEKLNLDIESKTDLYQFLVDNRVTVGLKYSWHDKIVKVYHDFEKKFIEKHPSVYQAYLFSKRQFNNLCTFAVSQTGIRVAGIASAVAVSVASGGMVPAVLAGAYVASIGIAVAQQSYSRMLLNSLHEEADLLVRYEKNTTLLELSGYEAPHFIKKPIEPPKKNQIVKWAGATIKYLSTYFCEAAVPVASAFLSPIGGMLSLANFGVFVGLAATGVGAGIYARKVHEDTKEDLKEQIGKARAKVEIPNYSNLSELKKLVIAQEQDLVAKRVLSISNPLDPALQDRSGLMQYWQGFKDVVNPFKNAMEVKNPKAFAHTVSSVAITLSAVAASSNPQLLIPALTTAVVTSAIKIKVQGRNASELGALNIEHSNNAESKVKALEIAKSKAKELVPIVRKQTTFTELVRKSTEDHPLKDVGRIKNGRH